MTSPFASDPNETTLGDVRLLAEGLDLLLTGSASTFNEQISTKTPYVAASPASLEDDDLGACAQGSEIVVATLVWLNTALDHCQALLRFSETAVTAQPTATFAPFTEVGQVVALDPEVDPELRTERGEGVQRRGESCERLARVARRAAERSGMLAPWAGTYHGLG